MRGKMTLKHNFFTLQINQLISHPLFSGSMVMIFGSNIANLLNYAYHLIMGRLLGPTYYGELAALFSLIGLLGVIPLSFNLVIVKYVSAAKTEQEISSLMNWFSQKVFLFASVVAVFVLVISPFLSFFMRINQLLPFLMVAGAFLFSTLVVFNRAMLQGLLRFNQTVATLILENSTRLILGVIFVLIGLSVNGAMGGLVIAVFVTWLLSVKFTRQYAAQISKKTPQIRPLFFYSVPVFIQSIALTSLYSTDLILVKHYFAPLEAGIYASLSTLGKIIFFGASPVSNVMFPIISRQYSRGENFNKVLFYSFLLTLVIALAVVLVYWLVPAGAISILFGPSYLSASNLLVWFGIFITLLTLSSFIVNFQLSLGRTKVVVLPVLAALAQIMGIGLYHESLWAVITVSITVTAFLFLGLLVLSIFSIRQRI